MKVYIVVGRNYGIVSTYFLSKTEAQDYLSIIKNLYFDEYRIIKLQPYGQKP